MADTTRTQISNENQSWYDRQLLDKAIPNFLYCNFAQVKNIPAGSGTDTIKFRRYALLAAATTPLSEGITPSGKQMSMTEITATVAQYGDYVTITDRLDYESIDPVLTEAAEEFGEQVGDTLDQLCRDVVCATTSKQYASTATSTITVTSAMIPDRVDIKKVVRTLKNAKAKMVTEMISPTGNYNTTPIAKGFIGICHPNTTFDLDDIVGWTPREKYSSQQGVMDAEVGSVGGVRFIESPNAKVRTGLGASGIDVYSTLIIARKAYAQTQISNETLKNIIKPLGSAGSADPLEQRATSGWKLTYVAKILNDTWMVDYQHAVSA